MIFVVDIDTVSGIILSIVAMLQESPSILSFCLTIGEESDLFLVLVTACIAVGKIRDADIYRITGTTYLSLSSGAFDEERVAELKKLLNSGTFYFSWPLNNTTFCLGQCTQSFLSSHSVDNRFFWLVLIIIEIYLYEMRFVCCFNKYSLQLFCEFSAQNIAVIYMFIEFVHLMIFKSNYNCFKDCCVFVAKES